MSLVSYELTPEQEFQLNDPDYQAIRRTAQAITALGNAMNELARAVMVGQWEPPSLTASKILTVRDLIADIRMTLE